MQAVIFCGIPATGKSAFYHQHFSRTHLRINLDMLRNRRREDTLIRTCIDLQMRFVSDNTNITRAVREWFLAPLRAANYDLVGYQFLSSPQNALERNAQRSPVERVPDSAIWGKHTQLEPLGWDEGFAELYTVRIVNGASSPRNRKAPNMNFVFDVNALSFYDL